ncbi:MAG: AraC family transcriptional regulator [Ferruginibacter sp.]
MKINSKDIESIEQLKNKIDANLHTHFSIEELASDAGMGTTKFKYLFRRLYDMGVFHYIQERRMSQATELLTNSDEPIKRIATIAGFQYVSNFTNAFKKKFGITPLEYRNKR